MSIYVTGRGGRDSNRLERKLPKQKVESLKPWREKPMTYKMGNWYLLQPNLELLILLYKAMTGQFKSIHKESTSRVLIMNFQFIKTEISWIH